MQVRSKVRVKQGTLGTITEFDEKKVQSCDGKLYIVASCIDNSLLWEDSRDYSLILKEYYGEVTDKIQ